MRAPLAGKEPKQDLWERHTRRSRATPRLRVAVKYRKVCKELDHTDSDLGDFLEKLDQVGGWVSVVGVR